MREKNRFIPLRRKVREMGLLLGVLLLVIITVFYLSNRLQYKWQADLNENKQLYSSLVSDLHSLDTCLYRYVQMKSSEAGKLCEDTIARIRTEAEAVDACFGGTIVRDFAVMAETYAQMCEEIIGQQNPETSSNIAAYRETKRALEIMDSLTAQYTDTVEESLSEARIRLEQRLVRTSAWLLAIALLVAIVFYGLVMGSARKIAARINALSDKTAGIRLDLRGGNPGDPEERSESGALDEIDQLSSAFDGLMDRLLREHAQELEKAEIEKRLKETELERANVESRLTRAKLDVLQARVNPHFLFNALNIIAGQAAQENADGTMEMIVRTAGYLRYSLDKLDKMVTVRDELMNAAAYLNIEKERFGGRLVYTVDRDPEADNARMPAIIVQPLCENAMKYSIAVRREGGKIKICSTRDKDRVKISVWDDGGYIAQQDIDRIRRSMAAVKEELEDEEIGIGIPNLISRMKFMFGEKMKFDIHAQKGKYTEMVMDFPYITDEKQPGGGGKK